MTAARRIAWLVVKGVPWLIRRGGDLGLVIVIGLADGLRLSHPRDQPATGGRTTRGTGAARPAAGPSGGDRG